MMTRQCSSPARAAATAQTRAWLARFCGVLGCLAAAPVPGGAIGVSRQVPLGTERPELVAPASVTPGGISLVQEHHRHRRLRHQHRHRILSSTVVFHHKARHAQQSFAKPSALPNISLPNISAPAPAPASVSAQAAAKPRATGAATMAKLLEDYDPSAAPSPVQADHLKVAFAFRANKLLAFDHVEQSMTVVGWVRQYWFDPRLNYTGDGLKEGRGLNNTWDSQVDFLPASPDAVWHPDVRLNNALDFNWDELCDSVDLFVYDSSGANVVETEEGGAMRYNVFWSRPCILKAKCDIKLSWYPFDTNICPLVFEPWADNFLNLKVAVSSMESKISLPEFSVKLGDVATGKVTYGIGSWPSVTIPLQISRHGHYYVVNFICPVLMIIMLTWVSFWIPLSASDRVAFTMTLLLTLISVNFITADKRPATQEDMWLDNFQIASLLLVVCANFYTVALHRAEPKDTWSKERKQERLDLLDLVERTARTVFPFAFLIVIGPQFLQLRTQANSGGEKDWSGQATVTVLAVMTMMTCILCSLVAVDARKAFRKNSPQSGADPPA